MTRAVLSRGAALLLVGGMALAACTDATPEPAPSTASPSTSGATAAPTSSPPTSSPPTSSPAPSPTPTPTAAPLPPLAPGSSRGQLLIVQRAEDASLVSGEEPIRLTLARTANIASWFTAPPAKSAGTMTTEEALLSLGWRPSDDGTTAALPNPRPNGLLASAAGDLPFTVQRANVRSDGTLVLDIRPMGPMPETVESFGALALTLDGVQGVLVLSEPLSPDLTLRVIVTGNRNQQAVVQAVDAAGEVLESGFVARDRPVLSGWLEAAAGATALDDPVLTFEPPGTSTPGTITLTGALTVDGVTTRVDRVVARWSLPSGT